MYAHRYLNMPTVLVEINATHNATLCSPAMGYAFAAGTTDGCGMFDFVQGTTSSNPFWNAISHVLATPSAQTVACHAPKPILLDTGDATYPYDWDPHIVPIQILKVRRSLGFIGRRIKFVVPAVFAGLLVCFL